MCDESAMENVHGDNFRNWSLVPIATAYLVLQSDGPDVEKKNDLGLTVRHWVSSLGKTVAADVEKRGLHNNLAYWAAAGMAMAAISDQDRRAFSAAVRIGAKGIDGVTPDGTLPLEMLRKGRALEYHIFALEPLMLIAQAAAANGNDLFHRNNNALQRVGERIFASRYDHSFFDERAGEKQTAATPLPKGSFVWAEIALQHYQMPDLAAFIAPLRPLRFDRMGGDMTVMYGPKS
jgi:poly(beta-D-mannuronate) lyase